MIDDFERRLIETTGKIITKPKANNCHLASLELENFKCFVKKARIDFSDLTLFFGQNSSGKSTVYSALEHLAYFFRPVDQITPFPSRREHPGYYETTIEMHSAYEEVRVKATLRSPWDLFEVTDSYISPYLDALSKNNTVTFDPNEYGSLDTGFPDWLCNHVSLELNKINVKVFFGDLKVLEFLKIGDWYDDEAGGQQERVRINLLNPLLMGKSNITSLIKSLAEKNLNEMQHSLLQCKRELVQILSDTVLEAERSPWIGEARYVEDDEGYWLELDRHDQDYLYEDIFVDGIVPYSLYAKGSPLHHIYSGKGSQVLDLVFNMVGPLLFRTIPKNIDIIGCVGPLRNKFGYDHWIRPTWHNGEAAWLKANDAGILREANEWLIKLGMNCRIVTSTRQDKVVFQEKREPIILQDGLTVSVEDLINGKLSTMNEFGTGFSQVAPIILAVCGKFEGHILSRYPELRVETLFLEQPELHLHPKAQFELGDLFLSATQERKRCKHIEMPNPYDEKMNLQYAKHLAESWENGLKGVLDRRQLVIETHSDHLLLRILRRIREKNEGIRNIDFEVKNNNIAVYFFQKDSDGVSVTHIPVNDDGDFSINCPDGFFADRAGELF